MRTCNQKRGLGVAIAIVAINATIASAQLAPTGSHYGARSSDTGYNSVSGTGGYAASVALELSPARGALPVPVAITHGGRGVGAAGLGWEVPLSFVRRDTTVARRRPAFEPGGDVVGREQLTVSLAGSTIQMLQRDTNVWVARQDAPDLELRAEGAHAWRLLDGAGRQYLFKSPEVPGAAAAGRYPFPDLWLLHSIVAPGGANRVELVYAIASHQLTGSAYPRGAGHSIDLAEVRYNAHPTQTACFKDVVRLAYNADRPRPLNIVLLGSSPIFRMRTVREVTVARSEACGSEAAIRRYELSYVDDTDTKMPRLERVRVRGRDGTTEATQTLPVAAYTYGTATRNQKLAFQQGPDIALPADVGNAQILASTFHDGGASSPGGRTYVSWHNLVDVTGDGRVDLVFRKNNQLWVAINRPDGGSSTTLIGGPTQLFAPASDNRPMAEHASETLRHDYNWQTRSQEWRKVIDINGDGRLDIIDAEESDGRWVVYLNTPGNPVTWVKRHIDTSHVKTMLESMGHEIEGDRVPLSRKTTGYNTRMSECWLWDSAEGRYKKEPNVLYSQCQFDPATTVPQERVELEKTYVEWMLEDANGDGYPDVIFNSAPVKRLEVVGGTTYTTPWKIEVPTRVLAPEAHRTHVLLNVAGVRLHTDNIFSRNLPLGGPACVPESWSGHANSAETEQSIGCALEDVNGDGVLDRIANGLAYLGAGNPFTSTFVVVQVGVDGTPFRFGRSRNRYEAQCVAEHAQETTESTLSSLRDMNGDGIPDLVWSDGDWKVAFGTGTGYAAPIEIDSSVFALSQSVDDCAGEYARTTHGLYDINGDGKPEVVRIAHNPARLEVFYLTGGLDGTAAAGRLTSVANGHGATTRIEYRSAKEHASSGPFPEIVVNSVETTGALGLGGSLSAVLYAYGHASMYFDPALDAFTTRGYERVVEVYGTGPEHGQAAFAIIRRNTPLAPYSAGMTDAQRFERYQLAGRPTEDFLLGHSVPRDPWQLLSSFDPFTWDFRQIGETQQEWKAEYQPIVATPANSVDCADVPDPYHWTQPPWLGAGLPLCQARGFSYVRATEQWSGTQPPPNVNNVQSRFEVLAVDSHGNVLRARNHNDLHDPDDDVCVEMRYAQPTTPTRFFSALAYREVTDCMPLQEARTLSLDSWDYDALPAGSVASGRVTSHTFVPHATDDGARLKEVRAYELSYDAVGNVDYMVTARRDGSVRAVEIFYDEFGVASIGSRLDATGLSPMETHITRDPLTLEATSTQDLNGTTWGQDVDGFGRITRSLVTPPGGSPGVVATTTYVGFDATSPTERVIHRREFQNPVKPSELGSTRGQDTLVHLDELGRSRLVKQSLGADYDDAFLIVSSRAYDGLGRVRFEADAHPEDQDSAIAYGTTYHYATDGTLRCSIRGNGPQAFNSVSDLASERFPTCFSRAFTNHTVQLTVSTPDTLVAGSPQEGVLRTDALNAVGRLLSRETTKNGARLELSRYMYDRLGQLTALTRYGAPGSAADEVTWSWRYDSVGRVLRSREPEMADRFNTYSDWNELVSVDWHDTVPLRLERSYDALGRITWSAQTEDGTLVPDTEYEWLYDTDPGAPLPSSTHTRGRLTRTTSSIGDMYLSYDAFGHVESRAFVDANIEAYIEKYERHLDGSLAALELQLPDTGYSPERYLYTYDSALRLRGVAHEGGQSLFTAHAIDAFARVRSASYGDNITLTANHADVGRRLPLDLEITHAAGTSRRIEYDTYDAVGRVLERHEDVNGATGSATASSYDAIGRLTASQQSGTNKFHTAFTYDPLGNVRSLVDTVSAKAANLTFVQGQDRDRDRICRLDYGPSASGPCNVFYDGSGNITDYRGQDGHDRKLAYYPSGAVQMVSRSDSTHGDISAQFRYDGSGEMSAVDIDGPHPANLDRRDRRYGLIEQRQLGSSAPFIIRRIPGAGGIVASRHGASGPWIFPFGEDRGTRFVSNGDKFVQEVSYLPFGEATSTGTKLGEPEYVNNQWNGGDVLDAIGVVQVGARIYDPAIGRFLSRDPLIIPRTASTTNPYAFAANDPINFSDPTGLDYDPNAQGNGICTTSSGAACGSSSSDPWRGVALALGGGIALSVLAGSDGTRPHVPEYLAKPGILTTVGAWVWEHNPIIPAWLVETFAGDARVGVSMLGRRLSLASLFVSPTNLGLAVSSLLGGMSTYTESGSIDAAAEDTTAGLGFGTVGAAAAPLLAPAASTLGSGGGIGGGGVGGSYETYYRTMSTSDLSAFLKNGHVAATTETFISPTSSFSKSYQGVLVQFELTAGTTTRLREIGVRAHGARSEALLGDLPLVRAGWGRHHALFKLERGQLNIGLGRGTALKVFNASIRGFRIIGRTGK